jgi:hypothetical protein
MYSAGALRLPPEANGVFLMAKSLASLQETFMNRAIPAGAIRKSDICKVILNRKARIKVGFGDHVT